MQAQARGFVARLDDQFNRPEKRDQFAGETVRLSRCRETEWARLLLSGIVKANGTHDGNVFGAFPPGVPEEADFDGLGRLREEATYRRGTSTSTDKSTFATIELASVTLWSDIRGGRVRLTMPTDSMHSFESPNNKIVWAIHVHGDIAMYPDVNDEFPLTVTAKGGSH